MKKVLVTGATGFIGNYVINELLVKGYTVIATSARLEKAIEQEWYKKVVYLPLDLRSYDEQVNYFTYFKEPDILIHLAWEGLPNYKDAFHLTENLPRHFSFLKNMILHGLNDLTVTGTCLEYGMQEGCLKESDPALPVTTYGKAKNELRLQLQALIKEHPFSLKWVRLFYMFGKGQNERSLLAQLDKALTDGLTVFNMSGGEQERDYLPVEKVAEYIAGISSQRSIDGIINCCSGFPVKILDFIAGYLKRKGKNIKLNTGYFDYPSYEPMRFWGDITLLSKCLKGNT